MKEKLASKSHKTTSALTKTSIEKVDRTPLQCMIKGVRNDRRKLYTSSVSSICVIKTFFCRGQGDFLGKNKN